jgi:hypothetical protein
LAVVLEPCFCAKVTGDEVQSKAPANATQVSVKTRKQKF